MLKIWGEKTKKAAIAPWFDVHGSADLRVFPFLAYATQHLLKARGLANDANELAIVPGGGHVPWAKEQKDLLRPYIQAFLVKHLDLEAYPCANTTK